MPTTCVIGAGGSGLVAAKVLLADGHDVRVFERERELGGVWAPWRAFPGLTTQTPGAQFEFSDFAFGPGLDAWPPAADVHAYLRAYAEHFGVAGRIAFGTEVLRLDPREDGGWTVTARRAGEMEIGASIRTGKRVNPQGRRRSAMNCPASPGTAPCAKA